MDSKAWEADFQQAALKVRDCQLFRSVLGGVAAKVGVFSLSFRVQAPREQLLLPFFAYLPLCRTLPLTLVQT